MKHLFAICILLLTTAAIFPQDAPAPSPAIEEIYLARDDGDGRAGEQVTEFRTTDVPIYCVILLESAGKTVVKMNFVALRVTGVKPETKVVTASYTTIDGQNRVNFSGRPDGRWTPGIYRVDVFLNGKVAKNIEFAIKGPGGNNIAAKFFEPPAPAKPKHARRPAKNQP